MYCQLIGLQYAKFSELSTKEFHHVQKLDMTTYNDSILRTHCCLVATVMHCDGPVISTCISHYGSVKG